jgi:hypothetical protein
MVEVVAGRAVGGDPVVVIPLPQDVSQCEGHRVEHLVTEVVAVLPHGLAVGGVAHDDDGHVRAHGVDDELAGRGRGPCRDDHEPREAQGLGRIVQPPEVVERRASRAAEEGSTKLRKKT